MWEHLNAAGRLSLILGTTYLLGAFALLIVMLTVDLEPEVFSSSFVLLVVLGVSGPFMFYLVGKEAFMKTGILARIRERRRIAAAADLAQLYQGIDMMSSPEAVALPIPFYPCSGCERYWNNTADKMYWVDEQSLLSGGWYCEDCLDKLDDKPHCERLNMELFLVMLNGDLAAD